MRAFSAFTLLTQIVALSISLHNKKGGNAESETSSAGLHFHQRLSDRLCALLSFAGM